MLGEAISMLVPQVVGFRLTGQLHEGATATDLVLTVTQILRETGVVGKFVEYFGHGLDGLPLADRATIGNMSPGVRRDVRLLPGGRRDDPLPAADGPRPEERVALVEAYCKENGFWHDPEDEPTYSQVVELDLAHRRAFARQARGARRTVFRSESRSSRSSTRSRASASTTATARTRPSPSPSPPATRPQPPRRATSCRGPTCTSPCRARRRSPRGAASRSRSTARRSRSTTARS